MLNKCIGVTHKFNVHICFFAVRVKSGATPFPELDLSPGWVWAFKKTLFESLDERRLHDNLAEVSK